MKYKTKDITPERMDCLVGGCPSIYEGLRELTPQEMYCIWGACPSTYEAKKEGKEVYLIIGRVVSPIDAGLEKKVGDGEALIEIPRALINEKRK